MLSIRFQGIKKITKDNEMFWGPIFQLQKFGDEPYLLLEPMGCGCVHFSSFPSKLFSISLIGCLYFLGQALRMQNLFVLSLFGRLIALCRIFCAFSVWLPATLIQKHCLALVGGKT
jgi:hypothetical protein